LIIRLASNFRAVNLLPIALNILKAALREAGPLFGVGRRAKSRKTAELKFTFLRSQSKVPTSPFRGRMSRSDRRGFFFSKSFLAKHGRTSPSALSGISPQVGRLDASLLPSNFAGPKY
jgi:hypothetical protein